MIGDGTDQIIKDLFDSFMQRYQKGFNQWKEVNLFLITLNRGGSYIDSPEWLKNKKSTINLKNNDDKYVQYVVTVALNH